MSVNINVRERQQKILSNIQDRPIPIETHGINDQRIADLTKSGREKLKKIKPTPIKEVLLSLLESFDHLRDNKSPIDAIRRNIETLWKTKNTQVISRPAARRVGQAIAAAGSTPSPSPSVTDKEFFAADYAGLTPIGLTETGLVFDTELMKDSGYEYTAGDDEVTILQGGQHDLDADVTFNLNAGSLIEFKLQVDSGAGWIDVPGSKSYCGV